MIGKKVDQKSSIDHRSSSELLRERLYKNHDQIGHGRSQPLQYQQPATCVVETRTFQFHQKEIEKAYAFVVHLNRQPDSWPLAVRESPLYCLQVGSRHIS